MASDTGFRDGRTPFRLSYLPWMTITLFGLLWAVHLATPLISSPQAVREAYGLAFNNVFSYLTHSLVHDVGTYHIVINSLSLLVFGSLVEAQTGRRWYVATVVLGILGGVAGVFVLEAVTGLSPGEKGIGFSAATSALCVLGISALVYQWHWGKVTCVLTLSLLWTVSVLEPEAVRQGGGLLTLAAVVVAIAGVCAIWYWVTRRGRILIGLTPLFWALFVLVSDLHGQGWSYTTAGHLGGLLAGVVLVLLIPGVRRNMPTPVTSWTKEGICHSCIRLWAFWKWIARPGDHGRPSGRSCGDISR